MHYKNKHTSSKEVCIVRECVKMELFLVRNTMSRYMTVRNNERVVMLGSVRPEPIAFVYHTHQETVKKRQEYVRLVTFDKKHNMEKVTLEIALESGSVDGFNNTIHKYDLDHEEGRDFVERVLSLSRIDIFIAETARIDNATDHLVLEGIVLNSKMITDELDTLDYVRYLENSIRNYE